MTDTYILLLITIMANAVMDAIISNNSFAKHGCGSVGMVGNANT